MVPKENGFNQSDTASCCFAAHCDVFQAGLPWQAMAKLYKGSIFVITETQFAFQITTKLHGTSTCGCNNNAMFSGRAIFTFPTVVVCWPC